MKRFKPKVLKVSNKTKLNKAKPLLAGRSIFEIIIVCEEFKGMPIIKVVYLYLL